MVRDNISNDDIITDDMETSKNSMQVYVAPCPLETKRKESKKEKEYEEEIFDTCIEIKRKEYSVTRVCEENDVLYTKGHIHKIGRTFFLTGTLKLSSLFFLLNSCTKLKCLLKSKI